MSAPRHRLADWPARFVAFLAACEVTPFGIGVHDCCLFAEADVEAITGAAGLIGGGGWSDIRSAGARLRAEGGLVAAVTSRLGSPLPTPKLAQRGDIVLVRVHKAPRFLAVCDADRWVGPHRTGLRRGPMSQVQLAWGVGRG